MRGAVQPVAARVLPLGREERVVHPLPLHPQHHHHVGVRAAPRPGRSRSAPARCPTPTGSSVGGATRVTWAPSVCSSSTLERATRLCSTSPTIATFSPAEAAQPAAHRVGVQQRLGGVLVGAVAGVDHAARRSSWPAGAGHRRRGCRITTASAPIACRVSAVSLRLSPLDTLEPLAEKLMTSARQPLGRRLEGDAGAGRVLVEQVDHGAAAQRRQLLDLAAGQAAPSPRRCRGPASAVAASRSAGGEQVR